MNLRDVLLMVHILAVAVWIGAAVALRFFWSRLASGMTAESFISAYLVMSRRLFGPAALLVLLSGTALVVEGPFQFDDLFVILGIAIVVVGIGIGATVFGPNAARMLEIHRTGSDTDQLARLERKFRLGESTLMILLLAAVALMVIKLGV